jgi:hypothetical protein
LRLNFDVALVLSKHFHHLIKVRFAVRRIRDH